MKKIIALTLLMITLCIPFSTTYADTSSEDIAEVMKSLNIMSGYTDGNLHLNDKLTRAQYAKMIINASQYKSSVSIRSTTSPFKDVPYSNWAAPYVSVAVSNGLIKGYPDSTFKPDKNVTLEEAITISLYAMGYSSTDFGSSWPYGQLGTATNIGLLDDVSANAGNEITRQSAMQIIFNMLNLNKKDGSEYIEALNCKLLEDVILIASNSENSSIGEGKISTSLGTYKISESFNTDNVGKKGNAILNGNDEIVGFIPTEQTVETYTAYAALDRDIVVATNSGYTQTLNIDENTTIYYKGQETSLQNIISEISVGDILKVSKSINGSIDFVVISGNNLLGPVIANGDLSSLLNLSLSNVTVLRNGTKSLLSDINNNDVVYYSQPLNILWVYNKKITGIYESASPNNDQPSKITVSGVEYSIETIDAFNKLSSQGQFMVGDSITLLLGKDGKIADVISPLQSDENFVGYLIKNGTKEVKNSSNYTYNVNYIKLATVDGDVLEYEANKDYSSLKNLVVEVNFSNGKAVLNKVSSSNLSGTFNWNTKKLGSLKVASDIKVMDVQTIDSDSNVNYLITYPQRINNVKLSSSNILYYSKNDNGEINSLILKDVTGDTYQYGIVTDTEVVENGMSISSTYNCDINGNEVIVSKSNGAYTNIDAGDPSQFEMDNNSIASIKSLSKISSKISEVNEISLKTSDGNTYLLSEDVIVYEKNNYSGYKIIPLSDLIGNENYIFNAYYDKSESNGGRIRVIIVTN